MEWIFDNFFVILHPVNRLYHALIREIQSDMITTDNFEAVFSKITHISVKTLNTKYLYLNGDYITMDDIDVVTNVNFDGKDIDVTTRTIYYLTWS